MHGHMNAHMHDCMHGHMSGSMHDYMHGYMHDCIQLSWPSVCFTDDCVQVRMLVQVRHTAGEAHHLPACTGDALLNEQCARRPPWCALVSRERRCGGAYLGT